MSNLIKYPFVDLRGKQTKVIGYEKEEEKFVPLDNKKKVLMKTLDEVEREKEAQALQAAEEKNAQAGFEAGVPVTNFDEIFEKKREEAEKEAGEVVAAAKTNAEAMIREAEEQVDEIREAARQEGIALGREEGVAQAAEEMDELREQLTQQKAAQEKEYRQMIEDTEGHYVEILCALLRKLTGIIVTDKQDIILHLIRCGIADMKAAEKYTIRVSPQDLLFVEGNKEDIMDKTGITGTLEVQEEKGLLDGECIIETDTQMIDCGFRTQLENMISTLRMLA